MIAPPDALVFSASKMSDEIRNPLLLSPKVPPSAAPVYVRMHFARDTNSCNDHPVMPPPAIARAAPDALARAQPTPRTKGLLKTPNSTSKRKSVIFVDNRNETAYLASASNDPDFIPGIIRMPTPGRPTPARAATGTTPAPTASAAKSSSKKRTTGEAERSPQGTASKRRKIGDPGPPPTTTVVMAASGAQIVTLAGAAPACEDIEDYFLHAANALFADILAGTARTPERYYGKGSASKGSAGKADKSPAKAEWADSAARTLFGTDKPSPAQTAAVERRFTEATGFLFQAPPGAAPTAEQVSVVTACFHNASAAVAGAPASSPGKTSPAVSQMFGDAMELDRFRAMQAAATGVALPPSAEKAGRRRSSAGKPGTPKAATPKGKSPARGKSPAKGLSKEDEAAAAEAWAAEVDASKTPARDFKAAAKGLKPGRNSRRSSSGAEWANEQFAEVAPKSEKKVTGRRSLSQEPAPVASGKKASRRSSAGAWANQAFTEMEVEDEEVTRGRSATPKATTPKGKSPAKGLSKEDEAAAAEAWAAEVAASKTPARDFKAAAKGLKPGRNSRRSSSGAEWANEQFAEVLVAPKSAEKLPASRRSLSPAAEPKAVPARRNRKSVLPALDSAGPLLAEATPEETAAVPPPRRGRKSVIPALPESEDAAPARRTRKSVAPAALPAPVEEAVEEAPARASKRKSVGAAPAGKRARSSLAAASPHVSIGKSVEYAITPRQKGDWRAAGLVDEEEEEEEVVAAPAPAKKAARGKKAAAAAPVEEEAAPAPAKKATRGKKAAAPVEEEASPAKKATAKKAAAKKAAPAAEPAPKPTRGKRAAAAAPAEEEPAPKRATRRR